MTFTNKREKETQQLEQRGNRLLRSGKRLLVAGACLAMIGAVSWFSAKAYVPSSDFFTLDVPDTIHDLAKELRGNRLIGDIQQLFESISSVVFAIAFLGAFATAMITGIENVIKRLIQRKSLGELLYALLIALGLMGITYICLLSWNPVSHELKAYTGRNLIEEMDQRAIPPERKASWDYQYLQAQQAILSGHADRSQLQDVLKQYSTRHIRYDIPAPVRYALEMQAFQLPLSDEARQFQYAQERKSTRWRNVSLIAFSGSCLLALAGLIASLTGKKVRSRVKCLRAIQ